MLAKLLTLKDVREVLACGRTKVQELIRSGRLRVVKIGERVVRIPAREIERFIREQIGDNVEEGPGMTGPEPKRRHRAAPSLDPSKRPADHVASDDTRNE